VGHALCSFGEFHSSPCSNQCRWLSGHALTGLKRLFAATDLGCSHREHCCSTIMPGHTLLAPHWTSWTLGTGRFFPILPIALVWHHRTSTCSPNWRSTFEVYASKLMKTSKRRSSDGSVCRMHHFTTKALALWSTDMVGAPTDMATTSKNRLRMCLYLTHVLLTVICSSFQIKNREPYFLTSARIKQKWI
jgi:hypothetical protein